MSRPTLLISLGILFLWASNASAQQEINFSHAGEPGSLDLGLPSSVMSSYLPSFGIFEMPHLVKDRAHMARIRDEIVLPILAPAVKKVGYQIVAVWENGFRHI